MKLSSLARIRGLIKRSQARPASTAALPLRIDSLGVSYDRKPVLWNVGFTIERGIVAGLLGPNGAGKTTLLKSCLGLFEPQTGSVEVFGRSAAEASGLIAYVPQRESIDWDFPIRVFDLVLMGRYGHLGLFRRPGAKDRQIVWEALKSVRMETFADRPIGNLSGGQQQRIFVARALAQQAELFFLDEPFAGVDATTEDILMGLFRELASAGRSFFIVHHDLASAASYFDKILLLNTAVVAEGKPADVLSEESLRRAFSKVPAALANRG